MPATPSKSSPFKSFQSPGVDEVTRFRLQEYAPFCDRIRVPPKMLTWSCNGKATWHWRVDHYCIFFIPWRWVTGLFIPTEPSIILKSSLGPSRNFFCLFPNSHVRPKILSLEMITMSISGLYKLEDMLKKSQLHALGSPRAATCGVSSLFNIIFYY